MSGPDHLPGAVLLDLDGTLVDTVGLRVRSWIEAFAEEGMTTSAEEVGPWMGADGRWLAAEVAAARGTPIDARTADRLDRVSGERFGARNIAPAPIRGARRLVELLTERSIPWAVATSSRPDQTVASLGALGLDHPPTLVDASHVERAKPEPDLLLAGAVQLGVNPAVTWYVGDSRWDMEAATRAGMVAVGVTTGATDAVALRAAGAMWVVDDLEVLADRLEILIDQAS